MKQHFTILFLFILPCILSSQTKKSSIKQKLNPYPLITPDNLAFNNKFDTVLLYNDFTSIGYASAIKDKRKIIIHPIVYTQIWENKTQNVINLYILFGDGETMGILELINPIFKKGIYELKNTGRMQDGYYSLYIQHGCSPRELYHLPIMENARSFLKIISYNEATGELKARFRVHYKMDESERQSYPNSPHKVLFEDSIIHTTVFKIYE